MKSNAFLSNFQRIDLVGHSSKGMAIDHDPLSIGLENGTLAENRKQNGENLHFDSDFLDPALGLNTPFSAYTMH